MVFGGIDDCEQIQFSLSKHSLIDLKFFHFARSKSRNLIVLRLRRGSSGGGGDAGSDEQRRILVQRRRSGYQAGVRILLG